MMRSVKTWLVPAVVALLAAVPFSTGCNDNGPTGGAITTEDLVATYTPEMAPAAESVTLQAGDAAASTDTFNLEIVVQEVDNAFAVGFTVSFNPFQLEFVGADFTDCFLAEGLADPANEFLSGSQLIDDAHLDLFATRVGDDLGGVAMDVGEQGVLGVLTFRAIQAIPNPADLILEDMDVRVCDAGGLCSDVDVTVGGGSVTAQ